MWSSNLHYNLLQQGAGKYEDSEESDFSQESEVFQASQETESSQEETENFEPWSRIFDEAEKRHETQLNALINEYEGDGDSENVARVKAENALASSCLQKRATVDACNDKRTHLQKSDGNPKKTLRFKRI